MREASATSATAETLPAEPSPPGPKATNTRRHCGPWARAAWITSASAPVQQPVATCTQPAARAAATQERTSGAEEDGNERLPPNNTGKGEGVCVDMHLLYHNRTRLASANLAGVGVLARAGGGGADRARARFTQRGAGQGRGGCWMVATGARGAVQQVRLCHAQRMGPAKSDKKGPRTPDGPR